MARAGCGPGRSSHGPGRLGWKRAHVRRGTTRQAPPKSYRGGTTGGTMPPLIGNTNPSQSWDGNRSTPVPDPERRSDWATFETHRPVPAGAGNLT